MLGVYFNRQGRKKGYSIFTVSNEKERLKNKALESRCSNSNGYVKSADDIKTIGFA